MATNKAVANSSGIGFVGVLAALFIGLKLTHVIDWSWFWVLSPIWISACFVVAFLFVLGIGFVAFHVVSSRKK